MSDIVRVQYAAGQAQVRIGQRTLQVERHDDDQRTSLCPIELVSAALGG
jgi:hypothetical protein